MTFPQIDTRARALLILAAFAGAAAFVGARLLSEPVVSMDPLLRVRTERETLGMAMERAIARPLPAGVSPEQLKQVLHEHQALFPEFLGALERLAGSSPEVAVRAVRAKLHELGPNEADKKMALLTALFRTGAQPLVAELAREEMTDRGAGSTIEDEEQRSRYRIRASQLFLAAATPDSAREGTVRSLAESNDLSLQAFYVSSYLMKYPKDREAFEDEARHQGVDLRDSLEPADAFVENQVPAEILGAGLRGIAGTGQ